MEYRLEQLCKIGSSKRIYLSEYTKSGIPFYRGKEIIEKSNGKKISSQLFISLEKYEEIKSKFSVPKIGDILISAVGTLGKSWFVDEENFYFKDGNLIWLYDFNNEIINNRFLYYKLKSKWFENIIDGISIGSTQKAITIEQLKKVELDVPDIKLQNKIVKILDGISIKIEVNNQINDNLFEIQKSYFKELFNNSNYQEISLDEICNISAGGDSPKEKSEYKNEIFNIPIISNGIDNEGIYGYTNEAKIKTKSITISARGTIGYKVLRDYYYYPIVRLISIIPKDKRISAEYLYYALDKVQIDGTGTTQQQLTVPMVKQIKVKMYKSDLIEQFTNFAVSINKKITKNKSENKNLAKLRDTLLPKLMNGEIDLDKIEI